MFKAFFWSGRHEWKHSIRAYVGAGVLLVVLGVQTKIALLFNVWNGMFFDSMSHAAQRPGANLWAGLLFLAWIAVGDIVFGMIASYAGAVYALWWREAITQHYLPRWKWSRRNIEGASQRIQQDPGELATILESMGLDFFRSVFTLVAFFPVLWALSVHVQVGPFRGGGILALIVLAGSISGVLISWFVGSHLPNLEYDNQTAEAAFRKQLVLA